MHPNTDCEYIDVLVEKDQYDALMQLTADNKMIFEDVVEMVIEIGLENIDLDYIYRVS